MSKYNFCHLHRHCEASIQDGASKIEDGVLYAKEMGHPAVAVTDHGNLISYVRFYNQAQESDIKHIFGLEAYLCDDISKKDKEHKEYNHCTILVKNKIGFKNIIKLNNIGHREGFYYKPRIDWDTLFKNKEGLIVLSGCVIGRTCQYILDKKYTEAIAWTRVMQQQFGEDYYIELMVSDFPAQTECNKYLIELSKKFDIPGVITGDAHYTKKEDYQAQKSMMLIAAKATVQELEEQQRKKAERKEQGQTQEEKDKIWIFDSDQYWMKTENEMVESWKKWHQEYYPFEMLEKHLNESGRIAEKIDKIALDTSYKMPKADVPNNEDHFEYLSRLCLEGLKKKGKEDSDEYNTRLCFELDIIKKKNLTDYFLVTADIIRWAKDHDIFVGPGRGSAGGSLVCYFLNITELDPIKHKLLFERFLDLGRQEMPDIDTDFEIDRRDEVKQYIIEKYHPENAASIATLGTFHARNITRDIARIYGHDPDIVNLLSKAIPEDATYSDGKLYFGDDVLHIKEIDQFFAQNPQIPKIASTLFGQIRHVSKHAAGMVITDRPLDECVPLINVGGECMTAWTDGLLRKELSQLNFLKLDILGLKTLSIIKKICHIIGIDYRDLMKLDTDDKIVYRTIAEGQLIKGIFQFDSNTGAWLYNHMRPKSFNDLIALSALDRPGPLDSHMAFDYVDRYHGKEEIEQYKHPAINEVLADTYGVIVFQEQLMLLAKNLSGFNSIESSNLRKNLVKGQNSAKAKKKQAKEREVMHKNFVDGAIKNGAEEQEVEKLWEAMVKFARYGFNKAHSVGYSYISYWTMWLKTYYTIEFFTAYLTYADEDDIPYILNEMRRMSLDLTHPNVNKSNKDFTADKDSNKVLFGLNKIKYLGIRAQDAIIAARPFKSFEDLCEHIPKNILNKRAKEALIRTGALKALDPDTGNLLTKLAQMDAKKKVIVAPIVYTEADQRQDEQFYLNTKIIGELKLKKRYPQVERQYKKYRNDKLNKNRPQIIEAFKKYCGEKVDPQTMITYEYFPGFILDITKRQSKRSGADMMLLSLDVYEGQPMSFWIMAWDSMYKKVNIFKEGQAVVVAIYKRNNKNEFAKIADILAV